MTNQPALFGVRPPVHPIADKLLPVTDADEPTIAMLARSIERHGLHDPITLAPDGRIIDGRLRELAARRVGIEPEYEQLASFYTDIQLAELFMSRNLYRYHHSGAQVTEVIEAYRTYTGGAR